MLVNITIRSRTVGIIRARHPRAPPPPPRSCRSRAGPTSATAPTLGSRWTSAATCSDASRTPSRAASTSSSRPSRIRATAARPPPPPPPATRPPRRPRRSRAPTCSSTPRSGRRRWWARLRRGSTPTRRPRRTARTARRRCDRSSDGPRTSRCTRCCSRRRGSARPTTRGSCASSSARCRTPRSGSASRWSIQPWRRRRRRRRRWIPTTRAGPRRSFGAAAPIPSRSRPPSTRAPDAAFTTRSRRGPGSGPRARATRSSGCASTWARLCRATTRWRGG